MIVANCSMEKRERRASLGGWAAGVVPTASRAGTIGIRYLDGRRNVLLGGRLNSRVVLHPRCQEGHLHGCQDDCQDGDLDGCRDVFVAACQDGRLYGCQGDSPHQLGSAWTS